MSEGHDAAIAEMNADIAQFKAFMADLGPRLERLEASCDPDDVENVRQLRRDYDAAAAFARAYEKKRDLLIVTEQWRRSYRP